MLKSICSFVLTSKIIRMANHIWNEDTESEEDDDWFYNSVRKYETYLQPTITLKLHTKDCQKIAFILSNLHILAYLVLVREMFKSLLSDS